MVISGSVRHKIRALLALAVLAMPLLRATPYAAADNVYPVWGDEKNAVAGPHLPVPLYPVWPMEQDFTASRSASGNLAFVGQFGEANRILLWQIGLDELARVVQLGFNNVAFSVQRGAEHQLRIGQFGEANRAFTWQEQQATAVLILQFGDDNAVSIRPGMGLRIHIMQLGR